MAKADLIRFGELLNSDAEFQEKFKETVENYRGPQDEKSFFENVLLPLGKEHGLSASYEEFSSFLSELSRSGSELSDDELEQVAGGKGGGLGALRCTPWGNGIGGGYGSEGGGFCIGIGYGSKVLCAAVGATGC